MIPIVAGVGKENRGYLETKIERMGHKIEEKDLDRN
jgi:GTP cyclohydrolase II